MATIRSGLFTLKEFSYRRNVLKLAPDAFVVINGALTSRVLSPMEVKTTQDIDIRGGITSINVSCAVSPPGASRATIEVVAPMYKGIHEDYYISLPNGTRIPFFMPMMEVKIYMKGRFIEPEYNYVPQYYPVFWGMITNVQQNYSDGNFTLSISCEDFLSWWKYQKITLNPSVTDSFFGRVNQTRFPNVFEKMSAWEIIYSLFTDSFFVQHTDSGAEAYYNFAYPTWSNVASLPDSILPTRETFGPLSSIVINYWNARFGLGVTNKDDPGLVKSQMEKVPLQMYGLQGPVKFESVKNKLLTYLDGKSNNLGVQADRRAALDLDFSLLSRVQPYGSFDLYGDGSESTIFSKLEIATSICEKVFMEFFVDTNGAIVFKPPFYNLDVASGGVSYYRIGPQDIINFNSSFDSNSIVNYLTVTGPMYQSLKSLEAIGFHADFDSIKQYGIRSEQINVPYGMNAKQLKMIAVAEMARINGQAYTGSVSIPLRPELRLGYPVYLEHIDSFYYVTGINHNFAFGSAATTDLTLQFRRERLFDDGNSGIPGSITGDVLYSCVMRDKEAEVAEKIKNNNTKIEEIRKAILQLTEANNMLKAGAKSEAGWKPEDLDRRINELKKQIVSSQNGIYEGPGLLGLWQIDRAKVNVRTDKQIENSNDKSAYSSNELVMFTKGSVPFTDKLGYRHIGAFPYGANLVLTKDGKMRDTTNFIDVIDQSVDNQLNSKGILDEISESGVSSESNQGKQGELTNNPDKINEQKEVSVLNYNKQMEKYHSMSEDLKQQQNPQANPSIYHNEKELQGIASLNNIDNATRTLMGVSIGNADACVRESNQNESTVSG